MENGIGYQDAIELGSNKSQARFLGGLCKGLVLDMQLAQGQHVRAEEAGQRAAAILDRKIRSICLQCRNTS